MTHGVHSMDVVAVQRFIKDENGNVADAAEVDKILDRKREPGLKGISDN